MHERIIKRIPIRDLMDLKVDFAFKQLFGSETNKHITIVFLNALLQRTDRGIIEKIYFKNIEIGGKFREDKQSRLDILVETKAKELINIEIQFNNNYDMDKRSLYYWAELYSDQLGKGFVYKTLNPVITINILNFNTFAKSAPFHTIFQLVEHTQGFPLNRDIELHFVEVPKLLQEWKTGQLDPWNDLLARWLLLLGIVNEEGDSVQVYEDIYKELEGIAMKDPILKEALEKWEYLSMSPEELYEYRGRMKRLRDERALIEDSMIAGREEGFKQGHQEGFEKGREEGKEEGIEKGTELAKREFVKKLIENGFKNEQIVQLVDVSLEQVELIRREQL